MGLVAINSLETGTGKGRYPFKGSVTETGRNVSVEILGESGNKERIDEKDNQEEDPIFEMLENLEFPFK